MYSFHRLVYLHACKEQHETARPSLLEVRDRYMASCLPLGIWVGVILLLTKSLIECLFAFLNFEVNV
jgi:hypothetical protein